MPRPEPLLRAVKPELNKDSSRIVILTEGFVTEPNYFRFFQRLNTRINLHIEPVSKEGNNPSKLLEIAKRNFLEDLDMEGDQLWFVIDTDQWEEEITEVREVCKTIPKFNIAQSNPCFEVWLFLHFHSALSEEEKALKSTDWKAYLNKTITGGFDHRKHSIKIVEAIDNAKSIYYPNNEFPVVGCTQVHFLAEEIYRLLKTEIDERRSQELFPPTAS